MELFPPAVTHTRSNRGNNLLNSYINYADCVGGDNLSFPVSLTAFAGYKLEAWAGRSCSFDENRTAANGACWRLAELVPSESEPPPIVVSVKNLLYGRTLASADATGMAAGASDGGTPIIDHESDAGACVAKPSIPSPDFIFVYFMLIDTSTAHAVAAAVWDGSYKLTGPPPPDHLAASGGPGDLKLDFSYQRAPADRTLNGFQFYCDPLHDVSDAGTGSCDEPSQLRPGALPPALDSYYCGSAQPNAIGGIAKGLVGDHVYHVGVAAFDTYDNVGVLSPLGCTATQRGSDPLDDSPAHGDAGASANSDATSSACSFSPARSSSRFALLYALVAGARVVRRRRAPSGPDAEG